MQGKLIRKFIAALLLISSSVALAQADLSNGFILLENGQFSAARDFFQPLYEQDQYNNKTVSICYGRAVGLSGQPEVANEIFQRLSVSFPGDLEVLLNLSES